MRGNSVIYFPEIRYTSRDRIIDLLNVIPQSSSFISLEQAEGNSYDEDTKRSSCHRYWVDWAVFCDFTRCNDFPSLSITLVKDSETSISLLHFHLSVFFRKYEFVSVQFFSKLILITLNLNVLIRAEREIKVRWSSEAWRSWYPTFNILFSSKCYSKTSPSLTSIAHLLLIEDLHARRT
jgi:hypothetical protein